MSIHTMFSEALRYCSWLFGQLSPNQHAQSNMVVWIGRLDQPPIEPVIEWEQTLGESFAFTGQGDTEGIRTILTNGETPVRLLPLPTKSYTQILTHCGIYFLELFAKRTSSAQAGR